MDPTGFSIGLITPLTSRGSVATAHELDADSSSGHEGCAKSAQRPGDLVLGESASSGLLPKASEAIEAISSYPESPTPLANEVRCSFSLANSTLSNSGLRKSSQKHRCLYCYTEFTRYHNLKSHLLSHSQEKPYVCLTCQSRFRRLHDLKRHTKLHTGERPHLCSKCGRKFAHGDALAKHYKRPGGCAGRRTSMGGSDSAEVWQGMTYNELEDTEDVKDSEKRPAIRIQDAPQGSNGPFGGYSHQSHIYPLIQGSQRDSIGSDKLPLSGFARPASDTWFDQSLDTDSPKLLPSSSPQPRQLPQPGPAHKHSRPPNIQSHYAELPSSKSSGSRTPPARPQGMPSSPQLRPPLPLVPYATSDNSVPLDQGIPVDYPISDPGADFAYAIADDFILQIPRGNQQAGVLLRHQATRFGRTQVMRSSTSPVDLNDIPPSKQEELVTESSGSSTNSQSRPVTASDIDHTLCEVTSKEYYRNHVLQLCATDQIQQKVFTSLKQSHSLSEESLNYSADSSVHSPSESSFIGANNDECQDIIEPAQQLPRLSARLALLSLKQFGGSHRWERQQTTGDSTSDLKSQDSQSRSDSSSSKSLSNARPSTKRRHDSERESGDSEEPPDRKNMKRMCRSFSNHAYSNRLLACPYYRFDVGRYSERNLEELCYRGCSSVCLRVVSRLKQHLYRVHRRPEYYCGSCYNIFTDQADLDAHAKQKPACEIAIPKYQEKMHRGQMNEIKRRNVGSDAVEEWFRIYKILFRGANLPPASYAYADGHSSIAVQDYLAYFQAEAPALLSELVSGRIGARMSFTGEQHHILNEAFEYAASHLVTRLRPRIDDSGFQDPTQKATIHTGRVLVLARPRPEQSS